MPNIWNVLTADRYFSWLVAAIHILIVIAGGFVLTLLVQRLLRGIRNYAISLMVRRGDTINIELEKRANTIVKVIRQPLILLIWVAVIITILEELNVRIEPVLAGAGLGLGAVGVAIGLGAQTLIKDILGGLFLLMENQIRVNDVAVINGTGGLVEEINLRTTVLRGENGAVHVFSNGSIQSLSNLTREFAFYVFEIPLAFGADPEPVLETMRAVTEEMRHDPAYAPFILADLDVMGVDRLSDAGTTVKARIKTVAMKQWSVGREMNRRLRARFQADQIKFPLTTRVVRLDPPPGVFTREDMKAAVRAALDDVAREKAV
jgi:small conductance mechanosensitive channel